MNNSSTEIPVQENVHHNVHVLVYLVGILSTSWTTGASFVILVCFYRNRRRQWTSFSRQVCSMTICDLLVGLTTVPILVMERWPAHAHTYRCSATYYLSFSMQCVTLLHVLGVCVFRNLSLETVSETSQSSRQDTYANCVIVASWTLSFGAVFIPFLLWNRVDEGQKLCYLNNLFGSQNREGMVFIGSFYCICQGLTNTIYLFTCVRLRRALRSIVPTPSANSIATVTGTAMDTIASRSSTRESTFIRSSGNPVNTAQAAQRAQNLASILKRQKQVIGTIGILLLLFNIFTFPLTMVFFVERSKPLDRNVRFFGGIMFMMNSGLNPIVYATRIKSIKKAIKDFLRDTFEARVQ